MKPCTSLGELWKACSEQAAWRQQPGKEGLGAAETEGRVGLRRICSGVNCLKP